MALTNSGTIAGDVTGDVSDAAGAVTLVNSGTIAGESGAEFDSVTQTSHANSSILSGGSRVAVQHGAIGHSVTQRPGHAITGTVDGGASLGQGQAAFGERVAQYM